MAVPKVWCDTPGLSLPGSVFLCLAVDCQSLNLACDRDFYRPETQSHSRDKRVLMVVFFTAHMLAHLRHLPRFPDFFVTFRILSPFSGNRMFVYARLLPKTWPLHQSSQGSKWMTLSLARTVLTLKPLMVEPWERSELRLVGQSLNRWARTSWAITKKEGKVLRVFSSGRWSVTSSFILAINRLTQEKKEIAAVGQVSKPDRNSRH